MDVGARMSIDTVDLLHAAEDEIGRLRSILDDIHRTMVWPWEWSSDTPESVWMILSAEGYTMPSQNVANAMEDRSDDPASVPRVEHVLDRYRPARYTRFDCVCQTGDEDDCDPECCGCPCNHGADG
jgi:hypothetical protein